MPSCSRCCFLVAAMAVTTRPLAAQHARRCLPGPLDTAAIANAVVAATDTASRVVFTQRLCTRPAVVAAAWVPLRDNERDYGPRLLVLRRGAAYVVTQLSRGMRDTNMPPLLAFEARGRVLVIADIGNEGSWGLEAYEFQGDTLRSLGIIDVGLPPAFQEDPDYSPINHVSFRLVGERWQAIFDTTIVLRPSQSPTSRRVLRGAPPFLFDSANPYWRLRTRVAPN
jgi:hypothetical protein